MNLMFKGTNYHTYKKFIQESIHNFYSEVSRSFEFESSMVMIIAEIDLVSCRCIIFDNLCCIVNSEESWKFVNYFQ